MWAQIRYVLTLKKWFISSYLTCHGIHVQSVVVWLYRKNRLPRNLKNVSSKQDVVSFSCVCMWESLHALCPCSVENVDNSLVCQLRHYSSEMCMLLPYYLSSVQDATFKNLSLILCIILAQYCYLKELFSIFSACTETLPISSQGYWEHASKTL